jgi:methionyl-tRNA formyltransferase
LHASLLPDYRGAAPIHWSIINGESKTGVTTFYIDEKIDTGAIILQDEIEIENDETVGILHDKLMTIGSQLVLKTLKLIENGNATTTIQPKSDTEKTAYKLHKENCKIDWTASADDVYNKIRGLNPFPSAWCYLENGEELLTVKIFEVEKATEGHSKPTGNIEISKDSLKVYVKDGYLIIKEIQLPGKRKMDVKSLLNGYQFSTDAKMR